MINLLLQPRAGRNFQVSLTHATDRELSSVFLVGGS